jgi:uncharacterized protein YqjF (DUF2071 family)
LNLDDWFSHLNRVSPDRVFLTAEWRHLAMLNYEVDPTLLRPLIPSGTELDCWNEKSFISLVGFRFLSTKIFGLLPIPLHSDFDEVNLRFYVRRRVAGELRRGVVFIREIVPRMAIAFVARTFYNERYVAYPMEHEIRHDRTRHVSVSYRWRGDKARGASLVRAQPWNEIMVEAEGEPELPTEGSVEKFIAEHYWGYAAQPDGSSIEYRVTHPAWRVWQVRQASFAGDTEQLYGPDFASLLEGDPHSALVAEGSAVAVMRGMRL